MYIVVTGAAGFVGANLIKALNERGETDIVAVDNLTRAAKFRNLVDCEIADYIDKDEFIGRLAAGDFEDDIAAVFHEGACSDTMESDGRYMMRNNYRYSVALLEHCQNNDIPLYYASSAAVYGAGTTFVERREHESPLNVYGYSKFLFDQHVRRVLPERTAPVVGFRYFNVYGPREHHKGRMASVALHFFQEYRANGRVRLFGGSGGYTAGEQRRDFVAVTDVAAVNLHFFGGRDRSGIYNVGTGRAQTFNEVATTVVNTLRRNAGEAPLSLAELVRAGAIEYIEFPPQLAGKYQSFTQADLAGLRGAGYERPMADVATGVAGYVEWLMAQESASAVT